MARCTHITQHIGWVEPCTDDAVWYWRRPGSLDPHEQRCDRHAPGQEGPDKVRMRGSSASRW